MTWTRGFRGGLRAPLRTLQHGYQIPQSPLGTPCCWKTSAKDKKWLSCHLYYYSQEILYLLHIASESSFIWKSLNSREEEIGYQKPSLHIFPNLHIVFWSLPKVKHEHFWKNSSVLILWQYLHIYNEFQTCIQKTKNTTFFWHLKLSGKNLKYSSLPLWKV